MRPKTKREVFADQCKTCIRKKCKYVGGSTAKCEGCERHCQNTCFSRGYDQLKKDGCPFYEEDKKNASV